MRTVNARDRRDDQPAFVLHTYPYRETSLIVEAFTLDFGRIGLIARGAKRPRSELRGLLLAFQPLSLSWSGSGELKLLAKAEWRGGLPLLSGGGLLCGFYLNELMLKLVPREDPHPRLFAQYESTLAALGTHGSASERAALLRGFELALLAELGYALPLTRDADTGAPIDPGERYHYAFDRGPRRVAEPQARWPIVHGTTLLALAAREFPDAASAAEAKRLMRDVLDHYLEHRRIFSRRIVQDLQALDDEQAEAN